eukprot:GHRR01019352.1.p1 GENE.GHRR01019352.1~~GHRR01019352.1.p1  ORF type:complete len:520 (+),score=168.42 GHRR01019352.1:95-1654(+)
MLTRHFARSCQSLLRVSQTVPSGLGRSGSLRAAVMTRKAAAAGAPQSGLTVQPSEYPQVYRDEAVIEDLHGVKVADPYRWLEDPDSPETQAFVEAQNKLTQQVLEQCETRGQFKELFTALYDYPKYGTPFKRGDRYYYYYNSGLQQQYVLYGQDDLKAKPVVLLDPNTLSNDGTIALKDAEFSENGQLMAYSLSSGGSDWCNIKVLSVGPGGNAVQHDDMLEHVKFSSIAWTHDHMGFFYNRFPDPKKAADLGTETDTNQNQLLCYHVVGQPQSTDVVVLADPNHPLWMFGAEVTDDGRYLIVYVSEGCQPQNRLFYLDLHKVAKSPVSNALDFSSFDFFNGSEPLPIVKLIDSFEASWSYVANDSEAFTLKTNYSAPRYRVVRVNLNTPGAPSTWSDIVPQHPKDLLQSAVALQGDALVVRHLRDVKSALGLHELSTGKLLQEFQLPGIGSVGGFSGNRKSREFFFSFTSFVEPGSTYRVDLDASNPCPELFRATQLKVQHNPVDYEVKQVSAKLIAL